MATMEMGKASASLNSRIFFKWFHSNSNYNLHFFLFFSWLADDVETRGENEEQFEDADK